MIVFGTEQFHQSKLSIGLKKKYFSIDWLMGEKISKNDNLRFENINEFETLKLFIKSNFSIISNGSYFRIKNFNT